MYEKRTRHIKDFVFLKKISVSKCVLGPCLPWSNAEFTLTHFKTEAESI